MRYSKEIIKQAGFIKTFIGENLVGSDRMLNTDGIRNTINKHGSKIAEAKRGQIAVNTDDFAMIPLILKEPNEIEYRGKNNLKQDVFYFKKKIKYTYVVAECVRLAKGGNNLVFATMFKTKK